MREGIHPAYNQVEFICSCGNRFITRSTIAKPTFNVEVCSACYAFRQGLNARKNSSRIQRFHRLYGESSGK